MKINLQDVKRFDFGPLSFSLHDSGVDWVIFLASIQYEHPEFGNVGRQVGVLHLQQKSWSPELTGIYVGEWGRDGEFGEEFHQFVLDRVCPGYDATFQFAVANIDFAKVGHFTKMENAVHRSPYMT